MRVLEAVAPELWDRVALRSPSATFFHTRAWSEAVEEAHPGEFRLSPRGLTLDDGSVAVLPLMEYGWEGNGFFRGYVSSPPGVYGGFIAEGELPPAPAACLLDSLRGRRCKRIDVFGNPYAAGLTEQAGWRRQPNFTHRIDLSRLRDEADLLRSYSHGPRGFVRKAAAGGYVCAEAQTLEEVRDYYGVYLRERESWGEKATNDIPWKLFAGLFRLRGAGAHFWVARWKGNVVAGHLGLLFNGIWIAWHAANDREHLREGVSVGLMHNVIQEAMRLGCRYFDFNPSGGHEGTARFKDTLGAERIPFTELRWDGSGFYRAFNRLRSKIHGQ